MKEELQSALVEKYPVIFSKSCEISCGDGWYLLIDTLCGNIQSHINSVARSHKWSVEKNEKMRASIEATGDSTGLILYDVPELVIPVQAQQIKEKFGTLRFYVTGGDAYIHGAIAMADTMSEHICEDCGNVGKRRPGSWIRTLCDEHFVAKAMGAPPEFIS